MPYSIILPLKPEAYREEGKCLWLGCWKDARVVFDEGQTTFSATEKLRFCVKHSWTVNTLNRRVMRFRDGNKKNKNG